MTNQNNVELLGGNNDIQLKNIENGISIGSNINNGMTIEENLINNSSTIKDWNLEGTVWYVGLQCPPGSKFSVPPCTGPYPNYDFTIKSIDGKYVYVITTDLEGKFRIFLEPSSYIINAPNMTKDVLIIKQNIVHPPINIIINSLLE